VQAARAGAREVTCVDSSQPALERVAAHAVANGVKLDTRQGDARDVLKALKEEGARFDVIVLDPPALIKRRKDLDAGAEHYAQLNRLAMQLLEADAGRDRTIRCIRRFRRPATSRRFSAGCWIRALQRRDLSGCGPGYPGSHGGGRMLESAN
jgi:23S rRNA G2069 N7-methylase RlmK/C1962 C5-methylase RlmI